MINPRKILVEIAKRELHVRETSPNQGPGIRRYWAATTYPDGYDNREPWCAAFTAWIIAQAIREGHDIGLTEAARPKSAAVRDWPTWAKRPTSGALIFHSGDKNHSPAAGDICWFRFGNSTHPNHIAIVTGPQDLGFIPTIEGNTNPQGSREGNGVFEKRRQLSFCRGFIRLAWKAEKV